MLKLGKKKTCQPKLGRARCLTPRLRRQKVAPRGKTRRAPGPLIIGLGKGLSRLGLAALIIGVVSALLLGAYVALAQGSYFSVREARVLGTGHLSRLQVLRAAGIGADSSLLALKVGLIQQRVQALPWVKSASVRRRLPGLVEIAITEHRPVYLAMVPGGVWYLDRDYAPFARLAGGPYPDLPILTGLSEAELRDPDPDVIKLLSRAKLFLDGRLTPRGISPKDLSEVHLDRVWGLSLVYNGLGAVLRLGRENPGAQLARLAGVLQDLKSRGELKRARIIDLSQERAVIVRLAKESA